MIEFFVPGNPKSQMRHRTYDLKRDGRVQVDPSKADVALPLVPGAW